MERVSEGRLRSYEAQLLDMINEERRNAGLQAVTRNNRITAIARQHARQMAASGRVYHNPRYEDASRVGAEHVGEVPVNGCSVQGVHDLVMDSPADRSTVLVREWSEGGVGIASNDAGKLFVVEAFAQPKRTAEHGRNPRRSRVSYVRRSTPAPPVTTPTPEPPSDDSVRIAEVDFERVEAMGSTPPQNSLKAPEPLLRTERQLLSQFLHAEARRRPETSALRGVALEAHYGPVPTLDERIIRRADTPGDPAAHLHAILRPRVYLDIAGASAPERTASSGNEPSRSLPAGTATATLPASLSGAALLALVARVRSRSPVRRAPSGPSWESHVGGGPSNRPSTQQRHA